MPLEKGAVKKRKHHSSSARYMRRCSCIVWAGDGRSMTTSLLGVTPAKFKGLWVSCRALRPPAGPGARPLPLENAQLARASVLIWKDSTCSVEISPAASSHIPSGVGEQLHICDKCICKLCDSGPCRAWGKSHHLRKLANPHEPTYHPQHVEQAVSSLEQTVAPS